MLSSYNNTAQDVAINGLLTFDRKFKIDPSIIKKINEMLDRKQVCYYGKR